MTSSTPDPDPDRETGAEDDGDRDQERTCAGCRQRDSMSELLRLRFEPAQNDVVARLIPDVRKRLGGRGVSVHPKKDCLVRAATRGGFSRALRRAIEIDAEELSRAAATQYARRVEGLLIAARRTQRIAVGTDAVRDALRRARTGSPRTGSPRTGSPRTGSPRATVLVVAKDAAGRRDELSRAADTVVPFGLKVELGRLFGRSEVGVVAILDDRIGQEVATAAARATWLSEDE